MYGSWTEIAVLFRKFLGFIWDLSDVFTAQIRSLKSSQIVHFGGWFWEAVLFILLNDDHEKCKKKFYRKLINCLGTGWENKK